MDNKSYPSDIKPNIINLINQGHQSYAKIIPAILAPINVLRLNTSTSSNSPLLTLPTLSNQTSPFFDLKNFKPDNNTQVPLDPETIACFQKNLNQFLDNRKHAVPISPNYKPSQPTISEITLHSPSDTESERMPLSNGTKVRISGILRSLKTFLKSKNEHRDIPKIPCNKLASFLREFFGTLKKADGHRYESKSLCVMFTCLRRHILDTYGFDMNSVEQFRNIKEELKTKNWMFYHKPALPSHVSHAYPVTLDDVVVLYKKRILGFHNPRALNNTLFHICTLLGFNKKAVIYNLTLGDFKVVYDSACSYLECITPQNSTITYQQHQLKIRRLAALPSNLSHCPVKTFEVLLAHRPFCFKSTESQLFLAPTTVNPREVYLDSNCWYKTFRMGVNGIGNIVRRLAEDGGLKNAQHMNNQSMRRNVFLETTFDFDLVDSFRGEEKAEFVKITRRLMGVVDEEGQVKIQRLKSQLSDSLAQPVRQIKNPSQPETQNKDALRTCTFGESTSRREECNQLINKIWPNLQDKKTIAGLQDFISASGNSQSESQLSQQLEAAKLPSSAHQPSSESHQPSSESHQPSSESHQPSSGQAIVTKDDLEEACNDVKSKILDYLKWSDAKFLHVEEQRLKALVERENRQINNDIRVNNMLNKMHEILVKRDVPQPLPQPTSSSTST